MDVSIGCENELLEVPDDGTALAFPVLRLLQCLVERRRPGTVDLDLLVHGEAHAPRGGAVLENLLHRAWLLAHELIAGKSHNREPALPIGLLQLLQLLVLRRQSTAGCDIDDQQQVVTVVGESG